MLVYNLIGEEMIRRCVLLLVIAGAIALLASCASDPIDEAMLPTRVPELDMQTLVRNAEEALPTPHPTPTNTPIPTPETVDTDSLDSVSRPSETADSDESIFPDESPITTTYFEKSATDERDEAENADAGPGEAGKKDNSDAQVVTGGSKVTTEAAASDVVTATETITDTLEQETVNTD